MGATDNNGIWKYDTSDAINGWPAYMNLGMNSVSNALTVIRQNTLYKASSLADANTKVSGLKASGLTPSTANPFIFTRSDTHTLWSYDNSAWIELGPVNPVTSNAAKQMVLSGTKSWSGDLSANASTGNTSITFPKAFSSAPVVVAVSSNARLTASISSITATGFQGNIRNNSNASTLDNSYALRWIAVGTAA